MDDGRSLREVAGIWKENVDDLREAIQRRRTRREAELAALQDELGG